MGHHGPQVTHYLFLDHQCLERVLIDESISVLDAQVYP
jgi:hypothetical protein